MNKKLIEKILLFFIFFLLLLILTMEIIKYTLVDFKSSFYRHFKNTVEKKENETYNIDSEIRLIDNFLGNKITVVNIYSYDNIDFLKSLKLYKYINHNYNNINMFDIVIKNDNIEDIISSNENKIEFLLRNYGIKYPILYMDKEKLKKQLGINFNGNKSLILDELGNIKYVLNGNLDLIKLKSKINEIIMRKKFFSIKNFQNNIYKEDEKFINSFSKIVFIENSKIDYPLIAILDSGARRILITSLDGNIIYDITSKNFCLPSGLKYIEGKLYLVDKCDSSIKIINLENQTIETFADDQKLFGISDFEFLDENNLLISLDINNGIGIYNLKNKSFKSLNEELNLNYEIGKIHKIVKYKGKFYYFDSDYNILYSFDGEKNIVEVNLNNYENITSYTKVKTFYINSSNNIYFIDIKNNKILHKIRNNLVETKFLSSLNSPKDMFVFKNVIYVLENDAIKEINLYKNKRENLKLNFSNDRKIFFNVDENIDIKTVESGKTREISVDGNQFSINNFLNGLKIVPYSPSFLAIFEKSGKNEVILYKILFYNNLINTNDVAIESGKEYVLYGKIYYLSGNEVNVKTVNNVVVKSRG